ncbi:MAG: hypothetical protein WBQ20_14320 [Methyloceanibacter sp.]
MSKTKIPTAPTSPLQTAEMSALGHEQTSRQTLGIADAWLEFQLEGLAKQLLDMCRITPSQRR